MMHMKVYNVEGLGESEAFDLFRLKAFKQPKLTEEWSNIVLVFHWHLRFWVPTFMVDPLKIGIVLLGNERAFYMSAFLIR
ncbi:hypothetical protein HN51_058462 [Arachis hypogaea]